MQTHAVEQLQREASLTFPYDDKERVRSFLFNMEIFALEMRLQILKIQFHRHALMLGLIIIISIGILSTVTLFQDNLWRYGMLAMALAGTLEYLQMVLIRLSISNVCEEINGFYHLRSRVTDRDGQFSVGRYINFPRG